MGKEEALVHPPKVFISYSHQPPEHSERVREIARRLAEEGGVEVEMDIWSVREGHDLNAFMERMVTDESVGKVIVFSNGAYSTKADARTKGVGTEAQIISAEVYGKVNQDKFIPVACEFDGEGNALMPTFMKGLLFIDFSSPEKEYENFERLVRRIFDKPEHTKPKVGKPPTFITEDTAPPNPLVFKLRRYRDALDTGKTNGPFLIEDFLDTLVEALTEDRIVQVEGEEFDDTFVRSLEAMKPLEDSFLELCDLWCRHSEEGAFVEPIVSAFERIRALGEWPEGMQTWSDIYGENFRFVAHEMFLSVIAILLRRRKYTMAAGLLNTHYVLPETNPHGRRVTGAFTVFREYSGVLDDQNRRLQSRRLNLHADFLKERATADAAPFTSLREADLVLFSRSLLVLEQERLWYPHTLLFSRYRTQFEFFQRAESLAFYKRILPIWNGLSADSFREEFPKRLAESRASRWNFDFHTSDWAEFLNLQKLGTRP